MKRFSIYIVILPGLLVLSLLAGCTFGAGGGQTEQSILVATDATRKPFASILASVPGAFTSTKEIAGFDIELMTAIAEEANLAIEFVDVGRDSLLSELAKEEFDVVISSLVITEELKQEFIVSDPYFSTSQLVTLEELNADINSNESYGIAISMSRPDLQAKINSGLEAIMAQGLIDELIDKWFNREMIRVATDAHYPPIGFITSPKPGTMETVGFDIDLMNAIGEEANLEIEFVDVRFEWLLTTLSQGKYDAAISTIPINEGLEQDFLVSDTYLDADHLVTVLTSNTDINSVSDLSGKIVGTLGQWRTGAAEVRKTVSDASIKTYVDVNLVYQDLLDGKIDAVVANSLLAIKYVGINPTELKNVGEVFAEESYVIAIYETNEDLREKINSGLKTIMEQGLIDELIDKWISGQ